MLSAHQVDALSGTLTALLAESQRASGANGNGQAGERTSAAPAVAVAGADAAADARP